MSGDVIQIGDILVREDVVTEYFCCDYAACKGQCCISGDSGAPLREEELEDLEKGFNLYGPLVSEAGKMAIRANGFFEMDVDGDLVTPLCKDSGACAFCNFTADGLCLCAIEKCGLVKPSSCRLYPIRQKALDGGGTLLEVHRWDICRHAFEKGGKEGIKLFRFLKKPITELFSKEFYSSLEAAEKYIENR